MTGHARTFMSPYGCHNRREHSSDNRLCFRETSPWEITGTRGGYREEGKRCIVAVYKRILSLCVGNRSLLARRYESYRFYSLSVKPRQQKLYVDSNLIRNRHCGTDKQTLSLSAGCVLVDERDRVTCPA